MKIGVIQGRLVPKYMGRYHSFPLDTWQQEFAIARELGLDCIEFIFDTETNPLFNKNGLQEIKALMQKTGINVFTVCADYFINNPLFSVDEIDRKKGVEVLKTLMHNGKSIGVTDIVIPFVDKASLLKNFSLMTLLQETLVQALPLAESLGINLALETDLPPKSFLDLLKSLNSKCIKVNYDTGNSASWGYDVCEELTAYGSYVSTVHIKDRKKGGGSVILGSGNAKIDLAMSELQKYNFQGYIILEAFRDDDTEVFKRQIHWFKPIFEKYNTCVRT